MMHRVVFLLAISILLTACMTKPDPDQSSVKKQLTYHLPTLYDYQLLDKQYQALSLPQVTKALADTDVVFIGEYHRNQASHLLQMRLLQGLHEQRKSSVILTMEQFERDQQSILDDYLASKVGERYLMEEGSSWKSYQGSYRPLVEYAKQHDLSVVAANAPGDIIRCIGRQGESYLSKLSAQEKSMIAAQPFAEVAGYADKYFGFMGNSGHAKRKKRMQQSYLAQLTRDNTMAESILKALQKQPNAQVVHLNGSFHSAGHLGTAGALKRMNPALKIAVITPIHQDELASFKQENKHLDDFYYVLNRQPKSFVQPDYMKKMRGEMFAKANEKAFLCE